MSSRKPGPLQAEMKRFLKQYPDTETIELLVPDIHGVLKGKRIRRHDFDKVCSDGFFFCGGATMLSTLGETITGMPYTETDGDPDVPAELVPGSIVPVPWAARPTGQALFRLRFEDGRPFFGDPRTVLANAAEPFTRRGVRIVMATELEFYLLRADTDTPTPRTARVPGVGVPQPGAQVYHPDDLWEVESFMNDVYAWCELQNVPADAAIAEYAQGQYEINLRHVDDPALACDHALLLKRIVKAAARKHGMVACFMAKPFADDSGNGLHIHMSMYDRNGDNWLSEGKAAYAKPPFSPRLRHAVGGMLKLMPESTALFAPNANSYRRLRPGMFAPIEPNWGVNHRVVSVRIPASDSKNLRFEHRVAGADANPFLVTAAILAAADHGIREKIDPGHMVVPNEIIHPRLKIPNRWDKALDKFARSKVLPAGLGAQFCTMFVENRRAESEQYHSVVPVLDFEWYLRAV
ncbi:MAG TPA: glutamine synthetase family protein [Woeseiaceae bacterium]|nr:glutamine synthetase family protein [Woeseiaceae bacterium]